MNLIDIKNKEYPDLLKTIKNPPQKIYTKGKKKLLSKTCISIIGTRECSETGFELAKKFSRELSNKGFCIVSGMARGIDTAAHIGALEANGETIAVLPCGFDNIFPKENENLFNRITNQGLAITEYNKTEIADSKKFIERNRIVSGLSIATLVIEAGYRSGTSVTAKFAMKEGRKVFCIPHEIKNKYGIGTNELIRRGGILVTNVKEILEEFPEIIIQKNIKPKNDFKIKMDIKPEYKKIYKTLINEKLTIDEISRNLKMDISTTNYLLTLMELEGLVQQLPGKEFRCIELTN